MKKLFYSLLPLILPISLLAQTALPTSWNFSNPGIASPPAGWTLGLGTNGNLTYAFGIGDAISARLDATGEYMMIHVADKPGPLSYYLSPQNAGAAWGGQFDIQESADGNSWTTLRSVTFKASTATNYTGGRYQETPSASARYIRFYYTLKLPGGSPTPGGNMGVDSVWIQAAPAPQTPVLQLKQGTTVLFNGATAVTGNASAPVFTVENKGTRDTLRIDSIHFGGAAAADFSASTTSFSISANGSTPLTLNFTAGASGSRKATLTLYSNDTARSPLLINLYGIGGNYATEPPTQPTNLNFSSVSSFGYQVAFTPPTAAPEYFLVLRKFGAAVNEVPVDGFTYRRGDYIGSAQVEQITSSNAPFKPNYILANSNYHYAIFSVNGPAGYENYLTSVPLTGSVSTIGKNYGAYYYAVNSESPNFISELTSRIKLHDTIYYSFYISRVVNAWLARDTSAGKKVVTCVYTGHQFVYDEPFLWANGTNGATLTREHTWAQSWMPSNAGNPDWPNAPGTSKELPEYGDVHNLFPAHQLNANARRSNYPFANVVTTTYTSPTGFGKLGKDSANQTVYEPRPEQKGDLARALFYMAVCYNGSAGLSWKLPSQQSLNILRQWHEQDPPDAFEIARHEFAASVQGNRNPFIDHPEWAERINFYTMAYIPGDTSTPKKPEIILTRPLSTDIWSKATPSTISWLSTHVDTLVIYLSTDSMKTWQVIHPGIAAKADSFLFTPPVTFLNPFGVLMIKDKYSATSDTSAYFRLNMVDGLDFISGKSVLKIYPNPLSGNFLHLENQDTDQILQVVISDLLGNRVVELENPTIPMNLQSLTPGCYTLQIITLRGGITRKLIRH